MLVSEYPTLEGLLTCLALFTHFLMPLNVPLTERHRVPVCHVTHHGIQAVLGVVAQKKYGTSLVVWDHGVLWRERLRSLSNFRGFPLFARNALIGLNRVVVQVVFAAADIVVPCCATNLDWERWLISRRRGGGGGGAIRRELKDGALGLMRSLKAFPVVNGMETYRFSVDRENESELPTAVMLSHVYELKGVKFAIRAAAVIVNEYGLSSYRLLIYGSLNKDPAYVSECRALIASNNLSSNVFLKGFGNAPKVLTQGWVFVNSSLSEGLPLALGEAGLCGLPVVCTDVGGSREVLTNVSGEIFGAVVPPRDVQRLAAAQIDVFGMMNGLEGLVKSPCPRIVRREDFLSTSSGGGVQALEKRIANQKSNRRLLGMRFREYVLSNFTMSRYLREHYCTLLTAESIYQTRRGTGMTETLISELIQERKLNTQLGKLMSHNVSRLIHSAINDVEQQNYQKMMMLNHKMIKDDEGSAVRNHENAVKEFQDALNTARQEADRIEIARQKMLSSLDVVNKMMMKKKKIEKAKEEKEEEKDVMEIVETRKLVRRSSVYNMSGDVPLETLEARQGIILRIQKKENELAQSLKMLRERFFDPLSRSESTKKKRISQDAIRDFLKGGNGIVSDMLSTVESIESKSRKFRDTILGCTQRPDLKTVTEVSAAVAQHVLDYAPNLAIFARYVSECSDSIDHINTCIHRHQDLTLFLDMKDSNEFMRLLVSPVVRICAYTDEVDEILHHTSAYHDDFDVWRLVKEAIRISTARVNANELENIKSKYHLRRLTVMLSSSSMSPTSLEDRHYELDKRVVVKATSPRLKRVIHRLVVFKSSVLLVSVVNSRWQTVIEISDFRVDFDLDGLRIYETSGDREIVISETVDDTRPLILQDTSISEVSELASFLFRIFSDRVVTISPAGTRLRDERNVSTDFDDDAEDFDTASEEEKEEDGDAPRRQSSI